MRKLLAPLALTASLALAGCATSPYGGYGGMGGPLEAVLGSVLGGSTNSGSSFQQAAVNACGQHASQYGRVTIQDVRQESSSSLRVYGSVSTNYGMRNFSCSFRSDGRITDFRI